MAPSGVSGLADRGLGIATRDVTSGYRCNTRQLPEQLDLDTVETQRYSFRLKMAYRCFRRGSSPVELPIRSDDRMAGKSNVLAGEIHKALLTVVRLRLRRSGVSELMRGAP